MLKRDRDMRQYGVARDQRMADATSIRRNVQQQQDQRSEGSFAVTTRQAFRGTGFSNRGVAAGMLALGNKVKHLDNVYTGELGLRVFRHQGRREICNAGGVASMGMRGPSAGRVHRRV